MSNVSIFEKKWIDLVFEGRNKNYGAYQLRRESSKTTLFAFFAGLSFICSVTGLGLFLSSFGPSPVPAPTNLPDDTIIRVDLINPPTTERQKHPPLHNPNTSVSPPLVNNQPFVAAPTTEARPDVPTTNPDTQSNGNPGTQPGNGPGTGTPGNGGDTEGPETKAPDGPTLAPLLDVQPEYPGGIKKFYEYVGRNFEKPDIENIESISVNVSFVIEKDGSMTDIKVLRNPGYGLDKEAVRVLRSLKTKWKPGIKNGQYVRTQYTLPIRIQVQ